MKNKIIGKLKQQTKTRYMQASDNSWLRGLIQTIPYVGSLLDTWAFQFAEKYKEARIQESINNLSVRLTDIEKNLDIKAVEKNTEVYVSLFFVYLQKTITEPSENMRLYLANATAHLFSKRYTTDDNKRLYLEFLSSLTANHILILKQLYSLTYFKGRQDFEKTKTAKDEVVREFNTRGLEKGMIYFLLNDLQSKGLVNDVYHPTLGGGDYTLHITEFGIKLLMLIEE